MTTNNTTPKPADPKQEQQGRRLLFTVRNPETQEDIGTTEVERK